MPLSPLDSAMPDAARPEPNQRDGATGPSERPALRRVGLLAVHGMGEQGRFQFLDGLVRDLELAFRSAAGAGTAVSVSLRVADSSLMGAAAPTLVDGPEPAAEIVVVDREQGTEVRVGVHEVWWGDVVDPPTVLQPAKFLAWGLAMWAVPLKRRRAFHEREPGTVGWFLAEPEPKEGRGFRARLWTRLRLFFAAYLVAVIGLVLSLGRALIQFLFRLNLPDPVRTAIAYMSDVKLYTQPTSPEAVPLDHLGQHARFAIRARVVRGAVDVAGQGYERWWVLAHSLGSVITLSGLMTPDGLLARYLDEARWRRLAGTPLAYRDPNQVPRDTRVACPAWLPPDQCLRRGKLLERFAGLVTYGSPLDKFAMIWPAVIPLARDQAGLAGRPWLNFFDETDPVAGRLDAFDKIDEADSPFRPRNIGFAAHWLPLYSHLRYLSVPRRDGDSAFGSLAGKLAGWWLRSAHAPLAEQPKFEPGSDARWLTEGSPPKVRSSWRARRAGTQATWAALLVGSPVATDLLLRLTRVYDLLERIFPGLADWVAAPFWYRSLTLAVLAAAIVAVAGLLGRLFVFSQRDIDPEAPGPWLERILPGATTASTAKPAVKDPALS